MTKSSLAFQLYGEPQLGPGSGAGEAVDDLDPHVAWLSGDFLNLDPVEQDAPLPARHRVADQILDAPPGGRGVGLVELGVEAAAKVRPTWDVGLIAVDKHGWAAAATQPMAHGHAPR